jgi:hypothetical protein
MAPFARQSGVTYLQPTHAALLKAAYRTYLSFSFCFPHVAKAGQQHKKLTVMSGSASRRPAGNVRPCADRHEASEHASVISIVGTAGHLAREAAPRRRDLGAPSEGGM